MAIRPANAVIVPSTSIDDFDEFQETLAYWGSATADENGNFGVIFPQALPDGYGLRIVSTTAAFGTIPSHPAGTSSKLSLLYAPPTAVRMVAELPKELQADIEYEFVFQVDPGDLAGPIHYRIEAPGSVEPLIEEIVSVDTITSDKRVTEYRVRLRWRSNGNPTVKATVTTLLGTTTTTYATNVRGGQNQIYLPLVAR